jgi:tetratricopeptide (TPR) repeat protein
LREESAKNNPVEKVYAAGSKLSLAVLYCGMGRYAEAERMFLDALTVYEKYVKKNSKAYTAKFADAKSGLGDLYRRMGRLSDGERELTRAVEIYRQLLDDTHGEHAPEFARVCIEAGVLFGEMGRHSEAAEFFDEARDLLRSAVRSNNDLYCGIAACAAYNYAVALVNGGDPEGAEDELASFRRKLRKDAEFDKESAFILERIEAASPELPKKYEVPVIARLYSM